MEITLNTSATRVATRMLVLALPLALSGCASLNSAPPQQPPLAVAVAVTGPLTEMITPQLIAAEQGKGEAVVSKDLSRLMVRRPPSYTIDGGDILSIVVWEHPELVGTVVKAASGAAELTNSGAPVSGFEVDPKGLLQFPFAGAVKLAGLTEDQARRLLEKKLARYIVSPKIALQVHAYRSKRVYIDGAVGAPGLQMINNIPMTLMEALNRAGGLLPTADQGRLVLERGAQRYRIDMRELVQKRINPSKLMLVAGDVVRVHSRDEGTVLVSGEVAIPRALTMHDGRLTLNEALGEAGGVSTLPNDARQVYVARKTKQGTRVFQLDVRIAGAMAMAEGFELHPNDVVHVAASPPANWNGNLGPLMPIAVTGASGVAAKP